MWKSVCLVVVCVSAVVAYGGCAAPCKENEVCCHSDNVSYHGKCFDNKTQVCCQTFDAPVICNVATHHCGSKTSESCASGPPSPPTPPVCTKASLGDCKDGQACCHPNNNLALTNKCFWPKNETCCLHRYNTYQPEEVAICNMTQHCNKQTGCQNA